MSSPQSDPFGFVGSIPAPDVPRLALVTAAQRARFTVLSGFIACGEIVHLVPPRLPQTMVSTGQIEGRC